MNNEDSKKVIKTNRNDFLRFIVIKYIESGGSNPNAKRGLSFTLFRLKKYKKLIISSLENIDLIETSA